MYKYEEELEKLKKLQLKFDTLINSSDNSHLHKCYVEYKEQVSKCTNCIISHLESVEDELMITLSEKTG